MKLFILTGVLLITGVSTAQQTKLKGVENYKYFNSETDTYTTGERIYDSLAGKPFYSYSIDMPFINEKDVKLVMDEFIRLLSENGFTQYDIEDGYYKNGDYFNSNMLTTESFLSYYNRIKKKHDGNIMLSFKKDGVYIDLKVLPYIDIWNNNKLVGYVVLTSSGYYSDQF